MKAILLSLLVAVTACGSATSQCDVDYCPAKFAAETDSLGSVYSIELSDDEIENDVNQCDVVELDGDEEFYYDYASECN